MPPPPGDQHHPAHGEAPWPMVLALSLTAAGTVAMFCWPALPLALARQVAGG